MIKYITILLIVIQLCFSYPTSNNDQSDEFLASELLRKNNYELDQDENELLLNIDSAELLDGQHFMEKKPSWLLHRDPIKTINPRQNVKRIIEFRRAFDNNKLSNLKGKRPAWAPNRFIL